MGGLGTGLWSSLEEIHSNAAAGIRYEPGMGDTSRKRFIDGWKHAVACVLYGAKEA
ncbi:glycerol kinase [compost metagenome]